MAFFSHMRLRTYTLIGLFLLSIGALQANSLESLHKITKKNLQSHVYFLSSDSLEGRLTGTMGEKLATHYIADQFFQLGLEPAGDNGTFFQEFNFTSVIPGTDKTDIKKNIRYGRNVLARLRVSPNSERIIVLGAHVDHLGRGELGGSRARNNEIEMIHPGADDNASGIASILEVAAKLSDMKKHNKLHGNKDIVFAAWSGEEFGIIGSSHFVKNQMKTTNKSLHLSIDAAINLDMVGHLRESLILQGTGSSSDWTKILTEINLNHSIPLIKQSDPYLPTDTTAFYLQGVPTLNFFTGAHDDYHTPRDKPETLNYEGLKKISYLLVDLILTLENNQNSTGYQKIQKPKSNTERKFRIYLGTIPDYASADISGVKISGVAKNSPAEKAGIKHDDVIIELAGKHIHDIYDYTFVLNSLRVDKPVKMVVLRKQVKTVLKIVAKNRM